MILILVSLLVALFLIFYAKIKYRFQYFKWHGIPGPEPVFPFGNTKSTILGQRNMIYDVDDVYRAYKDIAPFSGFYSMFTPYLLATDPALIKQMFIKDFNKFRNNDFTVNHARDPIIARNPFWLKDGEWKQRRNDATPSMTSVKLKGMYPIIVHSTKSFVDFLNRETAKDPQKAFDAREISARYTCDAITSCTFGADAQSFTSEDPYFFEKGRQMIRGMATALQSLRPMKMIPLEVETFFIEIAKEAIKTRLENKIKQDDFLNHIIALKDKRNMDDLDAAAECVTFFLDGFETSSVTIHHALHQLGRNKRIQDKLRAEVNEKIDTEDGLSYERVMEIPYLNQVFYETLRLHPPLLLTTRVCSEDVEVEGFKGHKMVMPKDSPIWVPIPSIQRDPEYFPNPELFNPERFDPEHGGVKAFKDRCVLIPFGDGPRICTGMRFAYMQVKAAIAEIVRNFEITVDSRTPENMKVSPVEFLNVPEKKIYLNFKPIPK